MNLFKRIEVVVLLILALGGAGYVLLGSRGSPESEFTDQTGGGTNATPATGQDDSRLHRCTIERDYGNARLDIELRFANRSSRRLPMQPPQVKLVTEAGREVPPFFLPFDPPPEIPAGTTQDVRLRYWLEKADVKGSLKLVIGAESIEVKSAAAFDLEKIKNKEPRVFTDLDWSL